MAIVSVIVPVYNTEKYLKQCIKSILKQTLTDIEIICVDDGSTDSSPAILDRFAKKDKRIKVIHKKNAGYGHTLNTGLKHSVSLGVMEGSHLTKDVLSPHSFPIKIFLLKPRLRNVVPES